MKQKNENGFGRVLKREYQLYLLQIRDSERMAQLRGHPVREKPLEEIRAEYEERFGSRFLSI